MSLPTSRLEGGTFQRAERQGGLHAAPSTARRRRVTRYWKKDVPGRVHRVNVIDTAGAGSTAVRHKFPGGHRTRERQLQSPRDSKLRSFASDSKGAARCASLRTATAHHGNGRWLREGAAVHRADGATAASVETFAQGLTSRSNGPLSAKEPEWFVTSRKTNPCGALPYKGRDQKASRPFRVVVRRASFCGGVCGGPKGGHFTRTLVGIGEGPTSRRARVCSSSVGS